MKPAAEVLDISREDLESLLERVRPSLPEEDFRKLKAVVEGLELLTELIADKDTTIRDLRKLLFPLVTEKTREVLERAGFSDQPKPSAEDKKKAKKPGHGRNGADAYSGATRVEVPYGQLTPGDRCPACERGRVYQQQDPRVLVRIAGQAPLTATVYELERLRCNLCGEVFTAKTPEGVGEEKYEDTATAMIAQLKYGSVSVYRHDAMAREQKMSPEERLRFHQQHSRPVMDKLHGWMQSQLDNRRTEPNSGLGKAIQYMLRHWKALTLFLRTAGAPLDNNICERSLKRAILHRKNSLFYKTLNGAQVGDLS